MYCLTQFSYLRHVTLLHHYTSYLTNSRIATLFKNVMSLSRKYYFHHYRRILEGPGRAGCHFKLDTRQKVHLPGTTLQVTFKSFLTNLQKLNIMDIVQIILKMSTRIFVRKIIVASTLRNALRSLISIASYSLVSIYLMF